MINVPKEWPIEEYKDVESTNYYNMVANRSNNDHAKLAEAHLAIQHLGRDNARTPMQWNSSLPNGGFTDPEATPWMKVNTYTKEINVAHQTTDKDSVLAFWRRMLEVRKQHSNLLIYGDFKVVDAENEKMFSFVKDFRGQKALVVCNFSEENRAKPTGLRGHYKYLVGNVDHHGDLFEPWEGRIYLEE